MYCWACGNKNCTTIHDESGKRDVSTFCERCGAYGVTYNCQDCLGLMCWKCGQDGDSSYQPDTGYYICRRCR